MYFTGACGHTANVKFPFNLQWIKENCDGFQSNIGKALFDRGEFKVLNCPCQMHFQCMYCQDHCLWSRHTTT